MKQPLKLFLTLNILFLCLPIQSWAKETIVVCKEPVGKIFSYEKNDNKVKIEDDTVSGAIETYSWNDEEKAASVIYSGKNAAPTKEIALIINNNELNTTLLQATDYATTNYVFYPNLKKMFRSTHKNYEAIGGKPFISAGIMSYNCEFSKK